MNRVSEESAQEQLDSFFQHYDIDIADMPKEQAEAINGALNRIKRAIRSGKVEIDGSVIKQTLINPAGEVSEIIYGELTGQSKMAMDSKKADSQYGRCYALLGSLSKLGEGAIVKLRGADLSIAECIGLLFLQV